MATKDLLTDVRKGLKERRGIWQQISSESGVPYFTLSKIASGKTKNPRWDSVSSLAQWLEKNEPEKGQAASA
jgi:predicted transcriptional regulator